MAKFERFFHNQGDRAELIANLNARLNTLPLFIESFLGEDADYSNVMDVHRMFVDLHEAPLIRSVIEHGFDGTKLHLTATADREDNAVALMYRALMNVALVLLSLRSSLKASVAL